jgi:catalase
MRRIGISSRSTIITSSLGILFRKMSAWQQRLLFENTARAMGDARLEVKQRHVANCTKADPAYGAGVAAALRLGVEHAAE